MAQSPFQVNGVALSHDGPISDSLLTVLHEHSFTATKLGCGATHCGACAVWVNGKVQLACDIPIGSSPNVTTLEGLAAAEPEIYAALISAFQTKQAAQCGYCSSGILMRAAMLLKEKRVSQASIYADLNEHLCRCGSHHRIVEAILLAASDL
jgi:nicotinate dehydrogenase subunit A